MVCTLGRYTLKRAELVSLLTACTACNAAIFTAPYTYHPRVT